jgi:phosphoribosylanthranilate isomerase
VRLRRGEGTESCELDVPLFVGVFRDASLDEIHRTAEIARLDLVQLHGSEDEAFIRAVQLPVIKALNVGRALPNTTTSAQWLMFDSGGGTGRAFDWSLLAAYPRTKPFFLAGGITPDNVEAAIRTARPDAIDVSSGVESAPGIKDHHKLRALFERVRRP